jgi:hypothetical protein
MALRADGVVVVWGQADDGETDIPPGLTNVTAVAAGGNHCLAIASSNGEIPRLRASELLPTWSSNGFKLSVPTQCGKVYRLEYKDVLTGNDWTPLPLSSGNGGMKVLTDFIITNNQRFYRVRQW